MGRAFEKQIKPTENHEEKQIKAIEQPEKQLAESSELQKILVLKKKAHHF